MFFNLYYFTYFYEGFYFVYATPNILKSYIYQAADFIRAILIFKLCAHKIYKFQTISLYNAVNNPGVKKSNTFGENRK